MYASEMIFGNAGLISSECHIQWITFVAPFSFKTFMTYYDLIVFTKSRVISYYFSETFSQSKMAIL